MGDVKHERVTTADADAVMALLTADEPFGVPHKLPLPNLPASSAAGDTRSWYFFTYELATPSQKTGDRRALMAYCRLCGKDYRVIWYDEHDGWILPKGRLRVVLDACGRQASRQGPRWVQTVPSLHHWEKKAWRLHRHVLQR